MRTLEVPLTNGGVALIDVDDLPLVSQYEWRAVPMKDGQYRYAQARGRRGVFMHRLIVAATKGIEVDHRDGDGLNNRRSNLRTCTQAQNQANRQSLNRNNRSGYRGVYFHGHTGRWAANIRQDRKTHFLGTFDTPEDAAKAYNRAAQERFGEFASLNPV